jgi:hypothetical protein
MSFAKGHDFSRAATRHRIGGLSAPEGRLIIDETASSKFERWAEPVDESGRKGLQCCGCFLPDFILL